MDFWWRTTRRFVPFVAFSSLVLVACGEDSPTGGGVPTFSTDAIVNYSVSRAGDVTVTSLTYRNETGVEVTVTNPSLPWFEAFSAPSGTQISLKAQVTVNSSGSAEITMRAGGNGANVDERDSRTATKAVSFALEIPAVTLP